MKRSLEDIVNSELKELHLELFELKLGGSKARPVIDVRIEKDGGERVSIEDCARASKAIQAKLDEERFEDGRYVLEVSSPGVERPLRNAADWKKYVGRRAVVTFNVPGDPAGRTTQEVELAGVEGDAGQESVIIRNERGDERRFPLAAVEKARLAFHWER
jgi:ribosome maturation factor RimP